MKTFFFGLYLNLRQNFGLGIFGLGKTIKGYKSWYSQLSCLTFSIKWKSLKPPPCLVDRWQLYLKDRKAPWLSLGHGKLVNKMQLQLQKLVDRYFTTTKLLPVKFLKNDLIAVMTKPASFTK